MAGHGVAIRRVISAMAHIPSARHYIASSRAALRHFAALSACAPFAGSGRVRAGLRRQADTAIGALDFRVISSLLDILRDDYLARCHGDGRAGDARCRLSLRSYRHAPPPRHLGAVFFALHAATAMPHAKT